MTELERWGVDRMELSEDGSQLLWRDPDDPNQPYIVAESAYYGVEVDRSFLEVVLEALRAALVAERS